MPEAKQVSDYMTNTPNSRKGKFMKAFFWGETGTCKTSVCLDFPQPLWFIDTEPRGGVEDIWHFYEDKNLEITLAHVFTDDDTSDSELVANPLESLDRALDSTHHFYREIKKLEAKGKPTGTIVVDDVSRLREWVNQSVQVRVTKLPVAEAIRVRWADLTKSYDKGGYGMGQDVWQEFIRKYDNILTNAMNSNCHFVCTAKCKSERVDGQETGRMVPIMRDGTNYHPTVVGELYKVPVLESKSSSKEVGEEWRVRISKCTTHPELDLSDYLIMRVEKNKPIIRQNLYNLLTDDINSLLAEMKVGKK